MSYVDGHGSTWASQAAYAKAVLDDYATKDSGTIRTFASGATRDTAEGKPDYEGFLSPMVIARFGEYMHKHRLQTDGSLRASDNWQKGMGFATYMKSLWRHFLDVWLIHRGLNPIHEEPGYDQEEALCGIIFNAQGYLHELLGGPHAIGYCTRPEHHCGVRGAGPCNGMPRSDRGC